MTTKLSEKKRLEHEERALRTAQGIAQVDRVMLQEDLTSKDLYISNVRPDPKQPRRFYPEDEHELAELAESIGRNGLLQPISVRPDPENADQYIIIVGERRWRASQVAGKTRIRAVIHQMDEYAIRAAQYAENNKRSDVSDVARARSLQAMYEEERGRGGGWAEVAKASGITRMHVNRLTSLLRLPDTVVEMIDRRLLASAHGYEIVRVVNHMTDEEIVRLAKSCRKPKRGEAFARSVESLREQINEYLDRIQARHARATVAATAAIPDEINEIDEVPVATSAVFGRAEQAVGDNPVFGDEAMSTYPAQRRQGHPQHLQIRPEISEGTEPGPAPAPCSMPPSPHHPGQRPLRQPGHSRPGRGALGGEMARRKDCALMCSRSCRKSCRVCFVQRKRLHSVRHLHARTLGSECRVFYYYCEHTFENWDKCNMLLHGRPPRQCIRVHYYRRIRGPVVTSCYN